MSQGLSVSPFHCCPEAKLHSEGVNICTGQQTNQLSGILTAEWSRGDRKIQNCEVKTIQGPCWIQYVVWEIILDQWQSESDKKEN